jgi:hypothetical protein
MPDDLKLLTKMRIRLKYVVAFILFGLFLIQASSAQKVVWNVVDSFNVVVTDAKPGTDSALSAARNYFESHPEDTVVLYFPPGVYEFYGAEYSFDFKDGWTSGTRGRLEITGAGYDKTVIITKDRKVTAVYGKDVYRILFKGIHFTRDYCTVTQGTVVSVSPGEVILDLHDEFPTPDSLWQYGISGGWGLYLKKYTNDPEDPQIIIEDNDQVPWDNELTYMIEGRRWRFGLKNTGELPPYQEGDIIGVKLKHGGQPYWFSGGDNIHFDSCKWTRKTRGKLRGLISNVTFNNCYIDRGPKIGGRVPCLASPGGGFQIGHDPDGRITNVVVENCTVIGTGDDNIALFSVDGGAVKNNYVQDGFARGILLSNVSHICFENNTTIRCATLWQGGETESNCTPFDNQPPSKPKNLEATNVTDTSLTLHWSPSADNLEMSHYEVYLAANQIGSTVDTFFQVNGLSPETYYLFRVQAVDEQDNYSDYSESLEITTPTATDTGLRGDTQKMRVYPNPAGEFIRIELDAGIRSATLEIYDMKGTCIKKKQLDAADQSMDIGDLGTGVYMFKLVSLSGKSLQQIIVKF